MCLRRRLFWTCEELRLRRRHRNQFQITQQAGRRSHKSGVLLDARGGNVGALKVKAVRGVFAPTLRYRARTSERERGSKIDPLASSETQIEDMAPKKSDKVRKLVPLKMPYEELRPFKRELSELRLEFLLWNWNCVSASICKEVMDKSTTEGQELRGNPMLWTIEYWTKVMGPCAGSDGDLLFEKNSVGLTRGEEFSYGPPFESGRQGTNGWKTVDYKDPKRRAVALAIMHILRPARTTYVTAWQVGFFVRIMKGQRVHWARIFYNLVLVNASSRWTGPLTNHITPFLVNFY